MKIIPPYIHGIMDYLMGALLIASPWLFGFASGGAETWIPVGAGMLMLGASLFTDYELGAVRQIPMTMHLMTDAALGLFLAASPWMFQFDQFVWLPHVIFGLGEIAAAAMTETQPSRRSARSVLGMR